MSYCGWAELSGLIHIVEHIEKDRLPIACWGVAEKEYLRIEQPIRFLFSRLVEITVAALTMLKEVC